MKENPDPGLAWLLIVARLFNALPHSLHVAALSATLRERGRHSLVDALEAPTGNTKGYLLCSE